jgi:hypothetical protein
MNECVKIVRYESGQRFAAHQVCQRVSGCSARVQCAGAVRGCSAVRAWVSERPSE